MSKQAIESKKELAQNNKAMIKKLNNDLELYNMAIEDNAEDTNAHYMKATTLVKLGQNTEDSSYYDQALECYNRAIELTDNADPLYLADRSKLYAQLGKLESVIEDIRKISKLPKADGVKGIYIKNVVEDIKKLDSIQDQVTKLEAEHKITAEQAEALSKYLQDTGKKASGMLIFDDNKNTGIIGNKAIEQALKEWQERMNLLDLVQVDLEKIQHGQQIQSQALAKVEEVQKIHDHKIKVHSKAITEINTKLNMYESVIGKMEKEITNSALSSKEKQQIRLEIKSLNQSVQNIAQKGEAQDSTIETITAELNGLLQRKEFDTTAFLGIRNDIKKIKDTLAKDQATTVKAITEIVYDNSLLNHQELLTEAIKMFGFDNTINLSQRLNRDLIVEAIEANDPEIILGGLMSLDESLIY